jgi:hypothetical protein
VSIILGKGAKRDQVNHIRLTTPEVLYSYLDRKPITQLVEDARRRLVDGLTLHAHLNEAVLSITAAWSRGRSWGGLALQDVERLRSVLILAQAILDKRHVDVDYRTFSRRVVGDSKILERLEGTVVRLLVGILDLPPDSKPREALRTIGLERFAPPLLIGGQVNLDGADLSQISPLYLGLSPKEADRIRFRAPPAYLLTIENFASFSRHLIEADPGRLGTTVYVGGYPSLATQQALRVLAGMLPETTPVFHWSDIDPDGTWIFRTIERAIGRRLIPHLMSPEIARNHGRIPQSKAALKWCSADSGIHSLVAYLASEDARTLEQEELDPRLPVSSA